MKTVSIPVPRFPAGFVRRVGRPDDDLLQLARSPDRLVSVEGCRS
jgi:hypothetical protein